MDRFLIFPIFILLSTVLLVKSQTSPANAFEQNPVSFIKKHVITTWYPAKLTQGTGVKSLQSGKQYEFGLSPVSDKSAYSLYPLGKGDGIDAYWLSTSQSLEIPAFSGSRIIFTPELNGCSLYVRYNPSKKTLSVFHHLRKFSGTGPGDKKIKILNGKYIVNHGGKDQAYDDVLSWEQYGGNVQQQGLAEAANQVVTSGTLTQATVSHLRGTHVTAFLMREGLDWYFVQQKFRHDAQTDKQRELVGFKLEGSQKTKIKIQPLIQKPPPAVLKPKQPSSSGRPSSSGKGPIKKFPGMKMQPGK